MKDFKLHKESTNAKQFYLLWRNKIILTNAKNKVDWNFIYFNLGNQELKYLPTYFMYGLHLQYSPYFPTKEMADLIENFTLV